MSGDGVLFTWDDKNMQDMIADTISHLQDMTPVMNSFSEYMVSQTDKRFDSETGPGGKKWQALSPMTKAWKEKHHKIDKILQQDGFLRLVHPYADSHSAGVYSDRIYAAIHNRGGMAGPGHKVKIPQREFLGFSDDDIKEFKETIKDFILLTRAI